MQRHYNKLSPGSCRRCHSRSASRKAAAFQYDPRAKPFPARPRSWIAHIPALSRAIKATPRTPAFFVRACGPEPENVAVAARQRDPLSDHECSVSLLFVDGMRSRSRGAAGARVLKTTNNHAKLMASPKIEGGEAPKGACQPLSALERGGASLRDAPAFRRFAAALPLAGLPPTGFNSGPRFLGRRPDAERPAFPILQSSELLAGRSLCRPGGVRVARERIANPRAGTALAPLSGVPSRRRPSMSEIRYHVPEIGTNVNENVTWRRRAAAA